MGTSNEDNSTQNDEEPILNLEEGPWPGPIEREVRDGEIKFGLNRISDIKSLRVKKHKKKRAYFRTVKAVIADNSIANERWDYKAEVSVTEQGKGLVRGICVKGSRLEDYSWNIEIHDASYELSQHIIPFLAFFGMDNKEQIHWTTQFVGFPGAIIDGFKLNNKKRPFIYAVPLKGLQVGQQHQSLGISDLGISGGESENTFYPIISKLNLQDQEPWKRDTPKAFGVVMANSLLEAEHLALERARLTADLVNYSIRIAASHWEDRRESFPLDWNEQYANKQISLYDFVLIREVESVKGWVRVPHLISDNEPVSFDNVNNRLLDFFRRFSIVFTLGDVHTQTGKRTIVKNEKRLISGIQRCLHWYGVSS